MGVYRTLVYKMHYKWPVYRWRYTGRIPYTMKKFQNMRGRIYLQRYTRIPLKICFSLSFVSSTTCSSTAARAGEGTPGTHCTQQRVDPPFCDSPLVYALTRLLMKKSQKYKNSQKQILHRFRPFLNHFGGPPYMGARQNSTFLDISRRFSSFLDNSRHVEPPREMSSPHVGGTPSNEEKSTKLPKNRFYTIFAPLELFNRA